MNKTREEFLKWYEENTNDLLDDLYPRPSDIYDYFHPPQSEDVKERAMEVARGICECHGLYGPNGEHHIMIVNDITNAILSFNQTTKGYE